MYDTSSVFYALVHCLSFLSLRICRVRFHSNHARERNLVTLMPAVYHLKRQWFLPCLNSDSAANMNAEFSLAFNTYLVRALCTKAIQQPICAMMLLAYVHPLKSFNFSLLVVMLGQVKS